MKVVVNLLPKSHDPPSEPQSTAVQPETLDPKTAKFCCDRPLHTLNPKEIALLDTSTLPESGFRTSFSCVGHGLRRVREVPDSLGDLREGAAR